MIIVRLPEIFISLSEVKDLMGDKFQFFESITSDNIFCANCTRDKGAIGMIIHKIYLSNLNDVIARGTCKECGGKVARVMETGEDSDFHERAMEFRKTKKN